MLILRNIKSDSKRNFPSPIRAWVDLSHAKRGLLFTAFLLLATLALAGTVLGATISCSTLFGSAGAIYDNQREIITILQSNFKVLKLTLITILADHFCSQLSFHGFFKYFVFTIYIVSL